MIIQMMQRFSWLFIFSFLLISSCKKESEPTITSIVNEQDLKLRLNQIQVIASHNSYRQMTTDTVFSFLMSIQPLIPPQYNPVGLDYNHLPIEDQMNGYGVRGLELDLYNDPQGGAFSDRKINAYVGLPISSGIAELSIPGMKILHIKDVDYNTQFYTFKQALQAIKIWSQQHPNHLPLFINIETKSDSPADDSLLATQGFLPAPNWDASSAEALEQELIDVFGTNGNGLIRPDDVRGNYTELETAVLQNNWPLLKDCRGKLVFIMEGSAVNFYKAGHPSLTGRNMFVYDSPGNPEAAFVLLNNSRSDSSQIRTLVERGYIIRTRSDEGTVEARNGDYSGMNAAFESGAQIVSTDYYKPDVRAGQLGWTNYHVSFPGNILARKNPVSAKNINVSNELKE